MKKFWTIAALLSGGFLLFGAGDAPVPPPPPRNTPGMPPPPPPERGPRRGGMRGSMIWRAFARMDEAQRKKMLELQRSDPEKFHQEMRKIAEKFHQEEMLRRQKLNALVEECRKCTDPAKKTKLKAELNQMMGEFFQRRIAELTRILEANKKHVAFMERELAKRKNNAKAIVETQVEALLSGELKFPDDGGRPPKEPHFRGPLPPPPRR